MLMFTQGYYSTATPDGIVYSRNVKLLLQMALFKLGMLNFYFQMALLTQEY